MDKRYCLRCGKLKPERYVKGWLSVCQGCRTKHKERLRTRQKNRRHARERGAVLTVDRDARLEAALKWWALKPKERNAYRVQGVDHLRLFYKPAPGMSHAG